MNRPRMIILLWGSLLTLLLAGGTALAQGTLTYHLTEATFGSGGVPAAAGDIVIQSVIGATSGGQFRALNAPSATGAESLDPPTVGATTFKLFLPVVAADTQ